MEVGKNIRERKEITSIWLKFQPRIQSWVETCTKTSWSQSYQSKSCSYWHDRSNSTHNSFKQDGQFIGDRDFASLLLFLTCLDRICWLLVVVLNLALFYIVEGLLVNCVQVRHHLGSDYEPHQSYHVWKMIN